MICFPGSSRDRQGRPDVRLDLHHQCGAWGEVSEKLFQSTSSRSVHMQGVSSVCYYYYVIFAGRCFARWKELIHAHVMSIDQSDCLHSRTHLIKLYDNNSFKFFQLNMQDRCEISCCTHLCVHWLRRVHSWLSFEG